MNSIKMVFYFFLSFGIVKMTAVIHEYALQTGTKISTAIEWEN